MKNRYRKNNKTHGEVGYRLYDNALASSHLISCLTGCNNSISRANNAIGGA